MSRRNYNLFRDFDQVTRTYSTWIHSVFLNAGGVYDDSWIQPQFDAHSLWISSLGVFINLTNLPSGGNPGQALTKVTSTDYDVEWSTVSGGGGGGASLWQILAFGQYP